MEPHDEPEVVLRRNETAEVSLRPSLLHAGARLRIGGELTIGSDPSSDLTLDPLRAAGRHAVVRIGEGGAPVIDDLSGIGLLVNDEVIRGHSRSLSGGDRITIGGEALYVTDGTEALLPTMGDQPGERHLLTIGSSPDCHIVLSHPSVSPIHAVVEHKGGGAFVRDHTARGGLLVNGQPVGVAALRPGAEIGIGPFRLVFDGATVITREAETLRLTARDVSQWVGERPILQPTNLSVSTSELVAVIGPSGAGKSTLLRLLAATTMPRSGVVTLGGEPIATRRSDLGYVPQDEIVHRELSVEEALRYAAALRLPQDSRPEDTDHAVFEIMEELGLVEHRATRVGNLSGGQRKRVGLATELVHQPAALLLDEPTTGLDPSLERRTMRLLRRLATDSRAVILVTHATKSLTMCDSLLVLAPGGYTAFYGAPAEALEFFAVEELDEIYDSLFEANPEQLAARFQATAQSVQQRSDAELGTMAAHEPGAIRQAARLSFPRETATLISRYSRVFTRDRRSLTLLLVQAPLMGILAAMLFRPGAFSDVERAKDTVNLIFLLITISVWMGAVSASREIVRERPLLMRETALGVRLGSYLSSKMLIIGALAAAQVTTMVTCVFLLRPPDGSIAGVAGLFACLLLAGIVSVTLGLAISAFATTENQANSLIPLALVPQLLLGGAIVAVAKMPALIAAVAPLVFSRWAFAGAGTAYHLQQRIEADPRFSRVQEYGFSFFHLSLPALTLIAMLFMSALLGLTAYFIRRGEFTAS
jgi:ABC transport system ATP-binding/permease protein